MWERYIPALSQILWKQLNKEVRLLLKNIQVQMWMKVSAKSQTRAQVFQAWTWVQVCKQVQAGRRWMHLMRRRFQVWIRAEQSRIEVEMIQQLGQLWPGWGGEGALVKRCQRGIKLSTTISTLSESRTTTTTTTTMVGEEFALGTMLVSAEDETTAVTFTRPWFEIRSALWWLWW